MRSGYPTRGTGVTVIAANGYAAKSAGARLEPFKFDRRAPKDNDVVVDILYCGVCHSDLFTVEGSFGWTQFPCVPGHEIIGRVKQAGSAVTAFKEGDVVGVGCMVDSCRSCDPCRRGLEPYCEKGFTQTYNSPDVHSGGMTLGGYSDSIVVRQEFVFRISHPEQMLSAVAPLLCAGSTTWSPLRHWKVGRGKRVGIVGIGGLGHMGIKLAKALGAEVVAFTTSPSKEADARRLGADEVVVSSDQAQMGARLNSLDFILNTVAVPHNLDAFLSLLRLDGTMTVVGVPLEPHPAPAVINLIFKRRGLAGTLFGGVAETQELLDFCAERNIVADVELIRMQGINEAYRRMLRNDVKYRFVIDMGLG
jgi:alcohol dehydrogenase (NADP+)